MDAVAQLRGIHQVLPQELSRAEEQGTSHDFQPSREEFPHQLAGSDRLSERSVGREEEAGGEEQEEAETRGIFERVRLGQTLEEITQIDHPDPAEVSSQGQLDHVLLFGVHETGEDTEPQEGRTGQPVQVDRQEAQGHFPRELQLQRNDQLLHRKGGEGERPALRLRTHGKETGSLQPFL